MRALAAVVRQNQRGDGVLDARRARDCARAIESSPDSHQRLQRDLEIDLVVGHVDARRVVDGVGVDAAAGERVLDAAGWVKPRLPPSATTRARSSPPFTRTLALALSPTSALVSLARLDVGADAAVEQQIRLHPEDRLDQAVAVERRRLDAEHGAELRRQRHHLSAARHDRRAAAERARIVVGPARARQREEPRPLGVRARRIRIGVEEDVTVVERGAELERPRQQQALPKTSPLMSPMPATVIGSRSTSSAPPSRVRKCCATHSQAPRAVMPSFLWS